MSSRRATGLNPDDIEPRETELIQHWQAYAVALRTFENRLGSNLVERFTAEVLTPFRSRDESLQVRAVAGWARWRPFELRRNSWPTDRSLSGLRDHLSTLIERSTATGWFGRRSLDPSSIELLQSCRDTLDQKNASSPPRPTSVLFAESPVRSSPYDEPSIF